MESDLESAVKAVGLPEDVVLALMTTLVDPFLPSVVSSVPPSEDVQIAVAKQMHAVVLLYNYHHRKQNPELEFKEFVNFCMLAIVMRPPLIAFMKMMKESKLSELNATSEDCLSVTEKAIKDACDIAIGLDASRDVPNMEGWRISKVAVLLIDSKKENCMLQFGAVTKGAWSLIEKELNESSITPEISAGNKVGDKRKRDNLKVSRIDTEFLQLGYEAVKEVTGISCSDLEVLEARMAYSPSKEKSAACFYIMQFSGSFNEHEQVPLKFLVESVQGPLAENFADGSWKTTPLVTFHHMLPYVELILSWLSGCGMKVNSSDKKARENCYSNNKCDDSSHGQVASPVDVFQSTEIDANIANKFVNILDSAESSQNGILEFLVDESEQPDKGLSCSPSRGLCEMVVKVDNTMEESEKGCDPADSKVENSEMVVKADNTMEESEKGCDLADPATEVENSEVVKVDNTMEESEKGCDLTDPATEVENSEMVVKVDNIMEESEKGCDLADPATEIENLDTESDAPVSGRFRRLFETTMVDNNVRDIFNEKVDVGHSAEKDERRICPEILDEDRVGCGKDILSSYPMELKTTNMNSLTNICTESEHSKSLNSKIKVYHYRRKNNSSLKNAAQLQEVVPDLKVDKVDSLKSNHTQRTDEKVSGDKGNLTYTCNQTGTAPTGDQQAQLEARIKHNREVQSTSDSFMPNLIQSKEETVSGDKGDHTHRCNQTSIAATGNQLAQTGTAPTGDQQAQLEARIKHNIEVQSKSDSFMPDLIQSREEMVSGDKGNLTNTCNQAGIDPTGDQQAQLEARIKHNIELQSTPDSFMPDLIQSREETVSGDTGDLMYECNHTGIAATGNQLAQTGTAPTGDQQVQLEARIKSNVEVQSTSDSFMPDVIQSREEMVSGDKGNLTNTCNQTGIDPTGDQQAQLEARVEHNIEVQCTSDSFMLDLIQSREETISGDKGDHMHEFNQTGIAAIGNQLAQTGTAPIGDQQAQLEARIKHKIEVQSTSDSFMPDLIQSREETVSGDMGDHMHECNQTGISATGNQLAQTGTAPTGDQQAQLEARIKHNIDVQSTSDSFMPDLIQSREETVSVDKGDHTLKCNETGIAATGNQLAHVEAKFNHDLGTQTFASSNKRAQLEDKIKHNIDVQSTSDSLMPDHIRSRDEMVSGDKGDHTHTCNRTGVSATGNQQAQVAAKFNHDSEQELENALTLLYTKRQELYSHMCNMEDKLALCEDIVARIRDGGEVDLAIRCINSIMSGKFDSFLENGNNGKKLDENNQKSQHGKPAGLSVSYLPGMSPCQDLEYTCVKNNWRLPRYLTQSSAGKFHSNVVVKGKDFNLHAKGGFKSNPREARENAAAEILNIMLKTFV